MSMIDPIKLPLYISFGVWGLSASALMIWLSLRLTAWKTGHALKDLTSQTILSQALAVSFLNLVLNIGIFYGHLILPRFDGTYVSYLQWIIWTFTFAIITKMMATFLDMNRAWVESIPKWTAFALATLILSTFISESSRYVWFAAHVVVLCVVLKMLWIYRRRSDYHALFSLCWISFFWLLGVSLPFVLGHSCLQILSFTAEWWWLSVASWFGQLFITYYICYNIHRLGKPLEDFIEKHRMFMNRVHEVCGIPGQELYPHLMYLPTTTDKVRQDEALESGDGTPARKPAIAYETDDFGMIITSEMRGEEDRSKRGKGQTPPPSTSPPTSSKRNSGYPPLHQVAADKKQ